MNDFHDEDPSTFYARLKTADFCMTPNGTPYLRTDESPEWAKNWDPFTDNERDMVATWVYDLAAQKNEGKAVSP